ncbi:tetratricopeptide repeat protein [Saccharospirillum sp. HFRX-1]|uniref:tetratricopeptide repeat protein n=1 Tax=unclassified Saccharospirillum TaxID=2633430 RepID=UPI0037125542
MPPLPPPTEVDAAANELHLNPDQYDGWQGQVVALERLIRAQRYRDAEALLAPCLDYDASDAIAEGDCSSLFFDVPTTDEAFVQSMQRWIELEPDNYSALLIMGELVSTQAWNLRGHSFSNRVHPDYLYQFRQFQNHSRRYFERALQVRSDLPYAYRKLIGIYSTLGDDGDRLVDVTYAQSQNVVPGSLMIAKEIVHAYQPRWGGSNEQMDAIYQRYAQQQPRFEHLQELSDYITLIKVEDLDDGVGGPVDRDQARAMLLSIYPRNAHDYKANLLMASLGGRSGDENERPYLIRMYQDNPFSETALNIGHCRCYDMTPADSLAITERHLERNPDMYYGWARRGDYLYNHGHYEESLRHYERALALRPWAPETLYDIEWAKRKLGMPVEDFETFEYFKELTVYTVGGSLYLSHFMDNVEDNIRPQISAAQWQGVTQLAEQELTLERFQTLLSAQLDNLEWDRDTWYETSLYFADFSHVAGHKSSKERERIREKFSDLSQPSSVRQVMALNQLVVRQMAMEFAPKLEAYLQTGGTL